MSADLDTTHISGWATVEEHDSQSWQITLAFSLFTLAGVISMLGCLAIMLTYIFMPDIRSYTRTLIFGIAFTEGGNIFGATVGLWEMYGTYHEFVNTTSNDSCATNFTTRSNQLCVVQGFITSFFSISSFIYNAGLSVFLLNLALTLKTSVPLIGAVHALAWAVPVISCVTMAKYGRYGFSRCTTAGWCWMQWKPDTDNFLWFFVGGKMYELGAEVCITICYIAIGIVILLRKRKEKQRQLSSSVLMALSNLESLISRLILVPIFFVLCYLPGFVRSYLLLFDDDALSDPVKHFLFFVHGIGNNLSGFVNFVIFVFLNKPLKTRVMINIRRWRFGRSHHHSDTFCAEETFAAYNTARMENTTSTMAASGMKYD